MSACPECGETIPPSKRGGRPRATCSPTCAQRRQRAQTAVHNRTDAYRERKRQRSRERNHEAAIARRAEASRSERRTCEGCGGTFLPARLDDVARWCGDGCRRRAETARPTTRATRLAADAARRAPAGWAAVVERFDPLDVYERDAWLCRICGGELDREADPMRSPAAPSIDHIRPLEQDGRHARSNVRAAHRGCNARRASRDSRRRRKLLA